MPIYIDEDLDLVVILKFVVVYFVFIYLFQFISQLQFYANQYNGL